MDESINRKERRMKLADILSFIDDYRSSKIFKKALEFHLAKLINKDRAEVYEKVLLYCPSLSEEDKKFIKDRIDKNKIMFDKRVMDLEKLIKTKEYSGSFKDEPDFIPQLKDFLYNGPATFPSQIVQETSQVDRDIEYITYYYRLPYSQITDLYQRQGSFINTMEFLSGYGARSALSVVQILDLNINYLIAKFNFVSEFCNDLIVRHGSLLEVLRYYGDNPLRPIQIQSEQLQSEVLPIMSYSIDTSITGGTGITIRSSLDDEN